MVSVIIPTFNEATHLRMTLASLSGQREGSEVIVSDAESDDGTTEIARDFPSRVLTTARRQRASQMNAGARAARGDVLLFLHADTRLAPSGLAKIDAAMRDRAVLGGGFARRYEPASAVLRVTCLLAEIRSRWSGWFLGDQAVFVRRAVFEKLGGFREWDIFEDLDFSRRLARMGRVVTLRPPVISSARRFAARGALRTTWGDLRLTLRHLASERAAIFRPHGTPLPIAP